MATAGRDFPFYDGEPKGFSAVSAVVALAGCLAGFAALIGATLILPGAAGRWLGVVLFVLTPLLGLAAAVGRNWRAIFHRLTRRDLWAALAFVPLTSLVPAAFAYPLLGKGLTAANPTAALMSKMAPDELALFVAGTAPQLLGEELITIIPFLVVISGLHALGASRWVSVAVAWIITALLFGALHLQTYHWHLVQAFVIIGAARLPLTACYIVTKNIWASFITHLTNDWLIFAAVLTLSPSGG